MAKAPEKPGRGKSYEKRTKPKSKSKLKSKPSESKASASSAGKACLRKVKSRELYAGRVYIDCDCYHRNGLQHDCPRTTCGGAKCTVKPWPRCELGAYFKEKWESYNEKLDELPPTSFCGPKEAWLAKLKEKADKPIKRPEDKLRTGSDRPRGKEEDSVPCPSERSARNFLLIPVTARAR